MATISGMDYVKMMNLIEEIDSKKTDMINVVDDIKASVPGKLAEAYSGTAAEEYKTTLDGVVTKIDEAVAELTALIKQKADENKSAYETQEAKMKDSISDTGV